MNQPVPLHNGEVFRYKRKLYAISDNLDDMVVIFQARPLPGNKKHVENMYRINKSVPIEYVKDLIRSGEITKYTLMEEELKDV
ncbi:hypothetical protein BH780_gp215 [Bacillus phage Eldridge]|uniref:Uncharacterized protein n=1 Tax=Bacillus phage Eldridge TaxID=1776293 RepID=A0A0Y0AI41_9CAUD|nr:hypothetical protein BH780_gp215 [Bacillus phage Eldridge]AMB18798.1 hypothetical protein Eldridge_0218 [Bacillus phage Eldridge]